MNEWGRRGDVCVCAYVCMHACVCSCVCVGMQGFVSESEKGKVRLFREADG